LQLLDSSGNRDVELVGVLSKGLNKEHIRKPRSILDEERNQLIESGRQGALYEA
jgi:hypothetical protein